MKRNKFLQLIIEPKNLRKRSVINSQISPNTNKTIDEIKWLFEDDFTKLSDVLKIRKNKKNINKK